VDGASVALGVPAAARTSIGRLWQTPCVRRDSTRRLFVSPTLGGVSATRHPLSRSRLAGRRRKVSFVESV